MISRLEHTGNGVDSSHAAGKNARCRAALKRREVRLHSIARWIRHARIFVSFILANLLLYVSGCWINRSADSAGKGITLLPRMDGASSKAWLLSGQRFS